MESRSFRLECGTKEEDTYIFSVKVPPRNELMEQLSKQPPSFSTEDIHFSTGVLQTCHHSIKLCFARNGQLVKREPKPVNPYEYQPMQPTSPDPMTLDIVVFVSVLPKMKSDQEILVQSLKIRFISDTDTFSFGLSEKELKPMGVASKDCEYEFGIYNHHNYKHWLWSADSFENMSLWNDKVTELRFTMHIVKREFKPVKFTLETTIEDLHLPFISHAGMLDTKPYFMKAMMSDVKFICGVHEFPAHRLVLSARSKYFENEFQTLDDISNQGLVLRITDCEPAIFKEVLRFMYCGEVENFEDIVVSLLEASDKYLVDDLHSKCERHLACRVTFDNLAEMYSVGTKYNGKLLVQTTKRLILSNREKFLANSEGFKQFTIANPELMFELFHMTNINMVKV